VFNSLRHLLPDSVAWRVVVERTLKKYLSGLSSAGTDAVAFVDAVSEDLWPETTRELEEWERQFDLEGVGTEAARRLDLAAAWAARGGQSPKYLQDVLRAAGFTGAYVYESFDRSDVSLSKYSGDSFSITPQDAAPHGFCFSQGGRYLFTTGDATDSIYRYTMDNPYDLTTAVLSDSVDVSLWAAKPFDVHVSGDGLRYWVLDADLGRVVECSMDAPFQLAGSTDEYFEDVIQDAVPQGFAFKPDGTAVYVVGTGNDNIEQYPLSTPWDITTMSGISRVDVSTGISNPTSITFNQDGTVMLMVGLGSSLVRQWNLATPWDVSTGTVGPTYDVAAVDGDPFHVVLEHGQMFVMDLGSTDIFRYTFGGPRDPNEYTNKPLLGTAQCGNESPAGLLVAAQCGEEPGGQVSAGSAVCNRFLANEVWYLQNDDLTQRAPDPIRDEPEYWPYFWTVGGTPYGTPLAIAAADRARLEKLLLKLGPLEKWIVTIITVS